MDGHIARKIWQDRIVEVLVQGKIFFGKFCITSL